MSNNASTSQTTEHQEPHQARPTSAKRRLRRFLRALALLAAIGLGVSGYAYWNNNSPRMSDAEFAAALSQSIERGRTWVCGQQDMRPFQYNNPAMHFMLQDMDRMYPNPVFAQRVKDFMGRPVAGMRSWNRLLNPRRGIDVAEMQSTLKEYPVEYRWLAYALDPARLKLDQQAEQKLFDPESSSGLVMAHQLWSLCHMRRLSDDPRLTDALFHRLCQRIAREHRLGVFVSKLHCDRPGFVMMAGHPEMINRRWIERIIENQRKDGGWNDRLYVFTVPTFLRNDPSDEHNTLVTLWALHQARYDYPEAFGLPPAQ